MRGTSVCLSVTGTVETSVTRRSDRGGRANGMDGRPPPVTGQERDRTGTRDTGGKRGPRFFVSGTLRSEGRGLLKTPVTSLDIVIYCNR